MMIDELAVKDEIRLEGGWPVPKIYLWNFTKNWSKWLETPQKNFDFNYSIFFELVVAELLETCALMVCSKLHESK